MGIVEGSAVCGAERQLGEWDDEAVDCLGDGEGGEEGEERGEGCDV